MLKSLTRFIIVLAIMVLAACSPKSGESSVATVSDTTAAFKTVVKTDNAESDSEQTKDVTEEDYATFFIVVADTGHDYYKLRDEMFKLKDQLKISIDTMGRYYNKAKNLIALPDNDEDELYAGNYFPRRYPSENLSLEYLDWYQRQAGENTIALVTGIYEKEQSADSALAILKRTETKGFTLKSKIYIGCMH